MDTLITNLIKRCKKNDEDAFNQLLSRYEGYLYRICYSFTRNKEEALDMMQEVYIRIFRGLNSFDETRPLLPWLKTVTVNTIVSHTKKNRLPVTSLDGGWNQKGSGSLEFSPADYLAAEDDPEETVIVGDTRDIVNDLIAQLPEQYRIALTLRYHEEMSYEQIAGVLGQPLGTVKNSVFRARNQLRKKMQVCELLEV